MLKHQKEKKQENSKNEGFQGILKWGFPVFSTRISGLPGCIPFECASQLVCCYHDSFVEAPSSEMQGAARRRALGLEGIKWYALRYEPWQQDIYLYLYLDICRSRSIYRSTWNGIWGWVLRSRPWEWEVQGNSTNQTGPIPRIWSRFWTFLNVGKITRPGKRLQKTNWKDSPCQKNWVVINYFDWAIFNSYVNVYQRVYPHISS